MNDHFWGENICQSKKTSVAWILSERLQKQDYSKAELKELEIQELTSLVFRLYCIGIVLEYAECVAV